MTARRDSSSPGTAPRLIVNVVSGTALGRKIVLEPGSELQVGRARRADLCISDDPELAGCHLVIVAGKQGHRLRDLGTVTGTWLHGERIEDEIDVPHAAWVRAGATDLLLCHEGWTGAHGPTPPDAPELAEQKAQALAQLRAATRPLYAVVDAARDGWVLTLLREAVDELRCLFDPPEALQLFRVAPFVIRLAEGSPLLERLVQLGWGQSWGVFLACERPFTRLRQQLQKVFDSTDPETGEPAYFRFYDPRVLRDYLPSCSHRDRAHLFGDIRCFWAEGADGAMLRFDRPSRESATSEG